jgi:hypothetical protein
MKRCKKPVKCLLCRKVRASRWITVADYFYSKALVIQVRGLRVGLCTKCWFGKNVFDMSCFYKVESKFYYIFCRRIPWNLEEGPEEEKGPTDGQSIPNKKA